MFEYLKQLAVYKKPNHRFCLKICLTYPILSNHLKGLFTNFEYIKIFSCLYNRNIFYERSILIKQLWLETIEKNGSQSYMYDIYNSTQLDWLWAPYFLNYFE